MSSSRKGLSRYHPIPLLLFLVLFSRIFPADDIPFEWTGVDRVVAVADLHGDYDKFLFILAHPQVGLIDGDLRWAGGKAHLVQLGDVIDRGPDTRKIFDLLRRLEKEAADAGGMVHMLLGNHEEMNITGISLEYPDYVGVEQFVSFVPDDFRQAKEAEYIKTLPPEERKRAREEGLDVATDDGLYAFWQKIIAAKDPEARMAYILGFNDTYGKWLIKQNTVIKINDVVYVHGGISEAFSKWPLREINNVMRFELEYFQKRLGRPQEFGRPLKPKLVYDPDGPLWFRGLATKSEGSAQAEIDRILANLGAKAIVVGHNFGVGNRGSSPIIGRGNVARFQDKVWIMDTGISGSYGGVPSALLYDHGTFQVWGETEEVAARSGIRTPPQRPLTRKEMESFLRTATIGAREPGPGGRTDAWRFSLESRGFVLPALFRYIDRRRPDALPDSYKYDLAAYALDKYLALGYVPTIVERQVDEIPGALQVFVKNAMSEAERKEGGIAPRDPEAFERAMADLLVFQNLVYDDCQNERDTLISGDDGRIYRVDFSEAFAPKRSDLPHCTIRKCSRLLYKKLLSWDDKTVADYLGRYLSQEEIAALNARRRLIIRLIQTQIKVMGEKNVLF